MRARSEVAVGESEAIFRVVKKVLAVAMAQNTPQLPGPHLARHGIRFDGLSCSDVGFGFRV